MVPITQIYSNSAFRISQFTDSIEGYISGVTLNTNGNAPAPTTRILQRALQGASAIDEANTDPPIKDKHQHKLLPGDSKLSDLGEEVFQIKLKDLYGSSSM